MASGTDKLRVYIAFYPRKEGDFHSAVLVVPKSPKPTTQAWRFDVHDLPLVQPNGNVAVKWTYGSDGTFNQQGTINIVDRPGVKVVARSKHLAAVMLVGKLKPSVDVEELRNFARDAVDISQHSPADKSQWLCHQWVMEVLDAMNAAGLFSKPLELTGSELWTKAHDFVGNVGKYLDYAKPLPTCDESGAAIKAEIPQAPDLARA